MSLSVSLKKFQIKKLGSLNYVKKSEFEFECEDNFPSTPKKNRVSVGLSVRISSSFTPKKQRECGFEPVRLWSM